MGVYLFAVRDSYSTEFSDYEYRSAATSGLGSGLKWQANPERWFLIDASVDRYAITVNEEAGYTAGGEQDRLTLSLWGGIDLLGFTEFLTDHSLAIGPGYSYFYGPVKNPDAKGRSFGTGLKYLWEWSDHRFGLRWVMGTGDSPMDYQHLLWQWRFLDSWGFSLTLLNRGLTINEGGAQTSLQVRGARIGIQHEFLR